MELTVPLDEAVAAARAAGVLPDAVGAVRGEPDALTTTVAVHELPGVPAAVRAATRFAGPVDVRVQDAGVTGRTWTLSVLASHPVIRLDLSGFVTGALRERLADAPPGLASVRSEAGRTLVEIDLDAVATLLGRRLSGLVVRVDRVGLGERLHVVAALA